MTRTTPSWAPAPLRGVRATASLGCIAAVVAFASAARAQDEQAPPGYPGTPGYPGQPAPAAAPASGNADDDGGDSGLGLEWVWLNAEAGYSYANMESFSQTTMGMQKTESAGPAVGVGAGVRLLFFTVGLRARDLMLDIGNLWELGAEAAFHLRVWHIDPYFGVRGGYNFIGSLNSSSVQVATGNTASVSIHGFDVGPMAGIDIYLSHLISIGADIDAQFLFIQRPPVALPAALANNPMAQQALTPQEKELYDNSGSSVGLQVTPTAHLGIHF